jgi:hypothetical protein
MAVIVGCSTSCHVADVVVCCDVVTVWLVYQPDQKQPGGMGIAMDGDALSNRTMQQRLIYSLLSTTGTIAVAMHRITVQFTDWHQCTTPAHQPGIMPAINSGVWLMQHMLLPCDEINSHAATYKAAVQY